jgi:succinyl-CoA synthetase beta subunit
MNIHEHQGKELFRKYGIATPNGKAVYSVEDAVKAAESLGGKKWVVKAQIHAGGRGKGGGVKLANSIDEVRAHASKILGMQLVTHQTGPEGKKVQRLLVEEAGSIAKELYLSMLVDRATSLVTFLASTEGGMDIEEVSAKTPEKIGSIAIDPALGFQAFHARAISKVLGIKDPELQKQVAAIGANLYRLFLEKDCSMVEINPLILTSDNRVVALDAKINFDDNAMFRHKDILEMRDLSEENPAELEASKFGLSYIALSGTVGCMVNGAGLAMSTMDIIKLYGESPANFLDVGGGATRENVTAAFKIITSDPSVKAILVNIFGGIMKCDIIAEGIIAAVKDTGLKVPLVVRLEGTNVDKGKEILAKSGLKITPAENLKDAGEKIAKAARGQH